MLFSRKPAAPAAQDGHDLVDELAAHVAEFHLGLADIEDRLHDRHAAVTARLVALENEAKAIQGGVAKILTHRKSVA